MPEQSVLDAWLQAAAKSSNPQEKGENTEKSRVSKCLNPSKIFLLGFPTQISYN